MQDGASWQKADRMSEILTEPVLDCPKWRRALLQGLLPDFPFFVWPGKESEWFTETPTRSTHPRLILVTMFNAYGSGILFAERKQQCRL